MTPQQLNNHTEKMLKDNEQEQEKLKECIVPIMVLILFLAFIFLANIPFIIYLITH